MSKMISIEDCCEVLDNRRIPITASQRTSGIYPYYGANGVQDYVSKYIFDDELVLVAEDGGNFGSTEKPIAYRVSGKCWVNNHAHVLKPKPGTDVDYLCYALMFYDVSGIINGATRQKLTQTAMRKMVIPLLSLTEQNRIAAVLDKANKLIAERKQQLEQLDLMVKSRFVEMFGDPVTNPMRWEIGTIDSVCSSIVRGPFGSALKKEFFVNKGDDTYKVYEQKNAIQKAADIGSYHITSEKYVALKRFECRPGDFIMSCSGTMGEFYQLPLTAERGVINQALCKFTLNGKMLPVMFLTYMKENIGNLESKGSGIQNIAAVSYVKKIPIPLPPLPLQNRFADFVRQADKSKFEIQQGLKQLELQYSALMQKYFG